MYTNLNLREKLIFGLFTFCWIFVISISSGWYQIFIFIVWPFAIVYYFHREISHPLVIYSMFFAIYSVFFPIYFYLTQSALVYPQGLLASFDDYVLSKTIFCNSIGYASFLFGVILSQKRYHSRVNYAINVFQNNILYKVPYFIILVLFCISLIPVYHILQYDFVSKNDIARSGQTFLRFYMIYHPLIVFLSIHILYLFEKNRWQSGLIVFAAFFLYFFIVFGITGERDVVVYFALILLIYISEIKRKVSPVTVLYLLFIGIFLFPVMHILKSFIIAPQVDSFRVLFSSGLENFFKGEFLSAGRNLYTIIYFTTDLYDGERISQDLLRFFRSNFLGINLHVLSTSEWYNRIYLENTGSGFGFSIVASGYLDFGYAGIILIMLPLGYILSFFYKQRLRNNLFYVLYLYVLLTMVYCIRQDIAVIINNSIKFGIIPVLILVIYSKIFRRKNYT
jgi:oligosaccharide repeat unit polymerase